MQEAEGTNLAKRTNGSWRVTLCSRAALALAALALALDAEGEVRFRNNTLLVDGLEQLAAAGCSKGRTGRTGLGSRRRALADTLAGSRSCRSHRAGTVADIVVVAAAAVEPPLQHRHPQQPSPSAPHSRA